MVSVMAGSILTALAVLAFATPTYRRPRPAPGAAASYMLARQMGGDAPLMAGIIALTTVGSAVMIPILLAVFHLG